MRLVCFLDVLVLKVRSSFFLFLRKRSSVFPFFSSFFLSILIWKLVSHNLKEFMAFAGSNFQVAANWTASIIITTSRYTKKLCAYICTFHGVHYTLSIVESKYFSIVGKMERGRKRNRMEKARKIILCCM